MSGKAEEAGGYFRQGYNCCQAVVLAFAEEAGLTAKEAALLGSSFGGGMGRLREVCGAVSGMLMVAGLLKGYVSPKDREGKTTHYALVQKLADEFRKKNGSIAVSYTHLDAALIYYDELNIANGWYLTG